MYMYLYMVYIYVYMYCCVCNPPKNIETCNHVPSIRWRRHVVHRLSAQQCAQSHWPRRFRRGDDVCSGGLAASGLYGSAQMGQNSGKLTFWYFLFLMFSCFHFCIETSQSQKNTQRIWGYHQQSPGWKWEYFTTNEWFHANKHEPTYLGLEGLGNCPTFSLHGKVFDGWNIAYSSFLRANLKIRRFTNKYWVTSKNQFAESKSLNINVLFTTHVFFSGSRPSIDWVIIRLSSVSFFALYRGPTKKSHFSVGFNKIIKII